MVSDHRAALARIERLCLGGLSAKRLREEVLAELRVMVPYDGHVFMLTDPVTGVGTAPIAAIPGMAWSALPDLIRARYLTTVNRWDRLQDCGTPVASLLGATDDHPENSLMWRGFQRDLGIVDVASVSFGDRHGRCPGRHLRPDR